MSGCMWHWDGWGTARRQGGMIRAAAEHSHWAGYLAQGVKRVSQGCREETHTFGLRVLQVDVERAELDVLRGVGGEHHPSGSLPPAPQPPRQPWGTLGRKHIAASTAAWWAGAGRPRVAQQPGSHPHPARPRRLLAAGAPGCAGGACGASGRSAAGERALPCPHASPFPCTCTRSPGPLPPPTLLLG